MATALSIFGIAYAASCVWLTVRVVSRKERWAKWTLAVALAAPVLYVASFGPVVWATAWDGTTPVGDTGFPEPPKATILYMPLYVMSLDRDSWGHDPIRWWMHWGMPYGTLVTRPHAALRYAGMIESVDPAK